MTTNGSRKMFVKLNVDELVKKAIAAGSRHAMDRPKPGA